MKNLFKPAFFIIAACIFWSCSTSNVNSRGEKYGGTLHVNATDVPDIIFPGRVLKQSEQLIINQVYDGLVKYNTRTVEIEPALAKTWRIERNETLYTFYLQNKARFHNDNCFKDNNTRHIVAADVKFSLEQIAHFHVQQQHEISEQLMRIAGADAILKSPAQAEAIHISGIEVINDTTIAFHLTEPDPLFIHYLASTNAKVFSQEAFLAYGYKSTVGSGAFSFKYPDIKGHAIILTANPNYYRQNKLNQSLPFIDTVLVSFITSPPKELLMFEQGLLDLVISVAPNYVTGFLDKHIDKFQSNPASFIMKQVTDSDNLVQYNFVRSNVHDLFINSLGYFDFTEVFFKVPTPQEIRVN